MLFSLTVTVLLHKWEFKRLYESLRILRLNFWKWVKKSDHQDFQILELGSPGTSWFWQLVQALLQMSFCDFKFAFLHINPFW